MGTIVASLARTIYDRVIGSYRSTLIGIGLGVAVIAIDSATTVFQGLPQGWAKIAAMLLVLVGGALKKKVDAVSMPTIPPAAGFARIHLLLALIVLCLGVASIARADGPVPAPTLGGTFLVNGSQATYGPRLLPGMLALDFKSGATSLVSIGGLAYGVNIWSDRPYEIGVAAFLGAQVGGPSSISTGLVISLLHYAVVGWHHGVTGGVKADHLVIGPSVAF